MTEENAMIRVLEYRKSRLEDVFLKSRRGIRHVTVGRGRLRMRGTSVSY